jgi:hypothetical protein
MKKRKLLGISWGSAMAASLTAHLTGLAFAGVGVVVWIATGQAIWNWLLTGLGFAAVGGIYLILANMATLFSAVFRIDDKIDEMRKVI